MLLSPLCFHSRSVRRSKNISPNSSRLRRGYQAVFHGAPQLSGWHRCSCDNMLTEASKDWLILERITQVASSPHWIISVWCISNERGVDFSLSSVYENGTITHHRFVPSLRLSEQKYLASSTYPYRRSLGTNRFISFGVL